MSDLVDLATPSHYASWISNECIEADINKIKIYKQQQQITRILFCEYLVWVGNLNSAQNAESITNREN